MAFKMKGSPMKRNFPGSFKQVADIDRQMEQGVISPDEHMDIKEKEYTERKEKKSADITDAKVKYIQHITGLHENPEGEKIEQRRLDYLESLNE